MQILKNLKIRNATSSDAATLCQWWNSGAVMAHAGFPNGLNTSVERITQSLAADSDETGRHLILEVNDTPIGEAHYRNKGNGTAEIGIKICEFDKQGKGYGTQFLKMLIANLFANGYEKIVLDTNLDNTRAQHVYENLGFQKLRINRDSWTNQLGVLQSSVDYALLKSQFVCAETYER